MPTYHEDGVYLGLAPEPYQADDALGSDALKTVAHSPPQWWWKSEHNKIEPPAPAQKQAHFRLGTAVHVCLLEGIDVYDACYGLLPTKEQYPEALVTVDDLKDECRDRRMTVSGSKEELSKRLLQANPDIQILDVIQAQWRRDSGLREVTPAEDRRIRLLHKMAMTSPETHVLPGGEVTTLRQAFIGGLSEVSVFWTDVNGIRQRARFDKLKPRVTLDLKTFSSWNESHDFETGLLREAKHRGYPLQTAHYDEGRVQLRRLVDEGKVFGGTAEERKMLSEVADSDVWAWLWVFAITVGVPLMKGVRYDLAGVTHGEWKQKRENALARFLFYREFFGGFEQMWFDPVAIMEPDDDDWGMA